MALNSSKCNHQMPLRFKGLNAKTVSQTVLAYGFDGDGVTVEKFELHLFRVIVVDLFRPFIVELQIMETLSKTILLSDSVQPVHCHIPVSYTHLTLPTNREV